MIIGLDVGMLIQSGPGLNLGSMIYADQVKFIKGSLNFPRRINKSCIDKAYKTYKENGTNDFTNVYLQDKVNDKYHAKSF